MNFCWCKTLLQGRRKNVHDQLKFTKVLDGFSTNMSPAWKDDFVVNVHLICAVLFLWHSAIYNTRSCLECHVLSLILVTGIHLVPGFATNHMASQKFTHHHHCISIIPFNDSVSAVNLSLSQTICVASYNGKSDCNRVSVIFTIRGSLGWRPLYIKIHRLNRINKQNWPIMTIFDITSIIAFIVCLSMMTWVV